MGNPVVHWELMSKQPEKVADFYARIFGWKVTHHPEINYRIVDTQPKGAMPGINGGIVMPEREGPWPGARSTSRSRRCPAWASSRSSPIPRGA